MAIKGIKHTIDEWKKALLPSGTAPDKETLRRQIGITMDTEHLPPSGDERTLAPHVCPRTYGAHRFELEKNPKRKPDEGYSPPGMVFYEGPEDEDPGTPRCYHCRLYADPEHDYENPLGITFKRELSSEHPTRHATGGWGGRAAGALARSLGFGS
jgi:hypothetical protein